MKNREQEPLHSVNLLLYKPQLLVREAARGMEVFDPVRRKYFLLNPEELVRQLLLRYLLTETGIPRSRMAVERKVKVGKLEKRFDLLLFDHQGQPVMVIECKRATEALDQAVIDQAGRYNTTLKAPFLMVTNGLQHLVFQIDFTNGKFIRLPHFPSI